jgi:hypothetical protein
VSRDKVTGERYQKQSSAVESVRSFEVSSSLFGFAKRDPNALHGTINMPRRSLLQQKVRKKRTKRVATHCEEEPHPEHATIPGEQILFLQVITLNLWQAIIKDWTLARRGKTEIRRGCQGEWRL